MTKLATDNLQYFILPGKPDFRYTHKSLYDAAFAFWQSFWMNILKENGTTAKVNVDEFLRQDRISVLQYGSDIVGFHSYTLFDLECEAPSLHSYFARFYNKDFMEAIANKNVTRVMTMEYFSVHKDWRSSKVDVSLAAVLCSLGFRLGNEMEVDGIITAARSDNGAAHLAVEMGGEALVKGVDIYNTPCDLILFEPAKMKLPRELPARALADQLWNRRIDTAIETDTKFQIVA